MFLFMLLHLMILPIHYLIKTQNPISSPLMFIMIIYINNLNIYNPEISMPFMSHMHYNVDQYLFLFTHVTLP